MRFATIKKLDSKYHSLSKNLGFVFMDLYNYSLYLTDVNFRSKINQSGMYVFADGYFTWKRTEKYGSVYLTGPDFFRERISNFKSLLIIGPTNDNISKFKEFCKSKKINVLVHGIEFPMIKNPYTFCLKSTVNDIKKIDSEDIFIVLGCPKQEIITARLLEQNFDKPKKIYAIGAAFNFLIGHEKRAPKFVRTIRIEWVYRFLLNPLKQYPRIMLIIRNLLKKHIN